MFSDSIIRHFLPILSSDNGKTFENWPMFDEVIRRTKRVPIFGPPCIVRSKEKGPWSYSRGPFMGF